MCRTCQHEFSSGDFCWWGAASSVLENSVNGIFLHGPTTSWLFPEHSEWNNGAGITKLCCILITFVRGTSVRQHKKNFTLHKRCKYRLGRPKLCSEKSCLPSQVKALLLLLLIFKVIDLNKPLYQGLKHKNVNAHPTLSRGSSDLFFLHTDY